MDTQKLIPKFKDLQFETREAFTEWLNENAAYTVEFFDDGQDLIKFVVHESGEIIHTEYDNLGGIYNGCFIVEKPVEFGLVKIYNPAHSAEPYYLKFEVETVTEHYKK